MTYLSNEIRGHGANPISQMQLGKKNNVLASDSRLQRAGRKEKALTAQESLWRGNLSCGLGNAAERLWRSPICKLMFTGKVNKRNE